MGILCKILGHSVEAVRIDGPFRIVSPETGEILRESYLALEKCSRCSKHLSSIIGSIDKGDMAILDKEAYEWENKLPVRKKLIPQDKGQEDES